MFSSMRIFVSRHLLSPVVALVVALGLAASGVLAAGMTPALASASETPADCCACAGNDMAMTASACFAVCIGMPASGSPAGTTVEQRTEVFERSPEKRVTGSRSSPDPFPPKLTILI